MARLLVDGFEAGAFQSNWVVNAATATVSTTYKKTGNYSFKTTNGQGFITSAIVDTNPTIYFKLHLYLIAGGTGPNVEFISFGNAAGTQISIGIIRTTGEFLCAARGAMNGTLLARAIMEFDFSSWILIEGKITLHSSTGIVQLRVNGVAAPGQLGIDFTGNTQAQATPNITWVRLGQVTEPGYNGVIYYLDGLVLDDANWIGDSRIIGIVPNGAGLSTQWTPSTGNNYACVDDIPPNDTDYIGINANDQIDLYAHASLPAEAYIIKSIGVNARVVKEGTSTPQNVKLALSIDGDGGSPRVSNSVALSYVMQWATNLWEINPATGLAFTPAEVNAMQFGIKSAA
jgi:hypothetical protein